MADVRDSGVQAPAAGARNLSAEEIAAQSFTSAFRGYDPAHVRAFLSLVSDRVATLEARNAELERELDHLRDEARDARDRLSHPAPSPESVAAASEFSGLLHAARERALEIEAAAAEQGERLIAEARQRAEQIREEAEAELAEANARADRLAAERVAGAEEMVASLRSEAEALGVKIREDAEREAATRMVDAREEANRIVEAAKEQGREVVREAQAVIAKRKRSAEAQLDQLRESRDRLLSSLQAARRAVDEVITGVESGRPVEAAREASVSASAPAESGAEDAPGSAAAAPGAGAEPTPPSGMERVATPPRGLTVVSPKRVPGVIGSRAAPPTEAPASEATAAEEPEERVEERRSSALRILRRGKPEARKAVHAEPAHPLGEPVEGVRIIGPKAADSAEDAPEEAVEEPVEAPQESVAAQPPEESPEAEVEEPAAAAASEEPQPEIEPEPEPEVAAAEPEPEVAASAEPEPASAGSEAPPTRKVDDLFARIRADREAAVAKAEEVLAASEEARPPAEEETPPSAPEGQESESTDDEVEVLLQRRDSAVEGAESQLTKRLKRALQDEQNDLLDRLRNVRGELRVDALLGEATAHRDRYSSLARPFLASVGREACGEDGEAAVASLAGELSSDLIDALRHRVERILTECASDGADATVVAERTSAIYREWKTQRAATIASHYVVAAHAAASYATMPEGSEGVWIVDDGGTPCPDCDDNALAGPTPRGERFPTGQLHPPAHAGCRCVIRVLNPALTT